MRFSVVCFTWLSDLSLLRFEVKVERILLSTRPFEPKTFYPSRFLFSTNLCLHSFFVWKRIIKNRKGKNGIWIGKAYLIRHWSFRIRIPTALVEVMIASVCLAGQLTEKLVGVRVVAVERDRVNRYFRIQVNLWKNLSWFL